MTTPVPAGWYQDPEDPSRTRYWDGTQWGELQRSNRQIEKIKNFVTHKRWVQLVLVLFLGMLIGASGAGGGAPSDWSEQITALQNQISTLDAEVMTLTSERDTLASQVADFKADAEAEQKAEADAEAARLAEEAAAAEKAAEEQAAADAAAKKAVEDAAAKKAAAAAAAAAASPAPAKPSGQTVYVTNTGSKYHQGGCSYLNQSKISISLSDAQAQGYDP